MDQVSFEEKMAHVDWLAEQSRWAAMTLPKSGTCICDDKTAVMDREYFERLGEYSLSLPTGTFIGKRWKRDLNANKVHWKCSSCDARYISGRIMNGGAPCTQPGCDGTLAVLEQPEDWSMGEYYDLGSKDEVGIRWRKIIVT